MKQSKIGIVGGSGYIGSALADYLSGEFAVKVIDKNPPRNHMHKIKYQQCDVVNYNQVRQALNDVELVIHTAIVQIPQINEQKKLGYEVNFLGTQNVCKVVDESQSIKGMIFAGTWHVFGERALDGIIDETFSFRPDKVEGRARLYALSKIAQEVIVRYYDEMSEKIYGVIRMGTVLGEEMPEKTAANIFITKGLLGESITPFKHSMYRPMLYVDLNDVCRAFKAYAIRILSGEIHEEEDSLAHIVNLCWAKPTTVIELAHIIRNTITELTKGRVKPKIEIIDVGEPICYEEADRQKVRVDTSKINRFLGITDITNPQKTIDRIIKTLLKRKEMSFHKKKGATHA